MTYKALDISHYVINQCRKKEYFISNLKLQKLLYFIQALFLIENGKVCFNDPIEAWDFGPVVPNVYQKFEKFGAGSLPEIKTYLDTSDGIWNSQQKTFDANNIKPADQLLINRVLAETDIYAVSDLVNITVNQEPWIKHYRKHQQNCISIQSMKEYFLTEESEKSL